MAGHRKSAPKVRDGRVQKKNNWAATADADWLSGAGLAFDRQRPGAGYRHLLSKSDVERFIALLPDWDELAVGLNTVVLDAGDYGVDGWHSPGVVGICAWERDLWIDYHPSFIEEHRGLIEALEAPVEIRPDAVIVQWTESTARAYQLLHVFLHELGHHHDRMTTRSARRSARGEPYAESYAVRYAKSIWTAYHDEFGF